MSDRLIGIVMTPTEAHEAKGVKIHRTIGSEKLVLLDPFLLLDHLSLANDGAEVSEIGFPRHPHRGIETLTYVLAGRVKHKDSLGNEETVGEGEAQWMTAGRGIFHEEMVFADGEKRHETLQLWLNLPAKGKTVPAAYRAAREAEVPVVTHDDGAQVRVIAGTYEQVVGPLVGIAAEPIYLDVRLSEGASLRLPAPAENTAFAYVTAGEPVFGADQIAVKSPQLVVFSEEGGDTVTVKSLSGSSRLIFVCAKPWKEPVLQYRSLVMSTVEQMRVALEDLERGTFA